MSAATALDKSKMVSKMSLTTRRHFLDQFLDVSGQNIAKAIAHFLQCSIVLCVMALLNTCLPEALHEGRRLTVICTPQVLCFVSFQLVEGNSSSVQDAAVSNNCNDDVTNIQNSLKGGHMVSSI